MGFIESYKQLEKLCGEVLNDDRCISAYIDQMINTPRGATLVRNWDNDLRQLKHYRWVRNRIAHEPGCSEQNMCEPGDTIWLNNFYSRILNRTDPLALYYQATVTTTQTDTNKTQTNTYPQQPTNNKKLSRRAIILIISLSILYIIIHSFSPLLTALYNLLFTPFFGIGN